MLALVAAALCAPAWVAHAAPTDAEISEARERFTAARKLEDAGHWAEALTLFQRVAEVKMTPQVRFHVALCMENVGLWTQALDGYAQAVGEAGTTAPEVLKEATEHMHRLEADIPTVSLAVLGAVPSDELFLDRRRLPIDGSPLPIRADPGAHTAEVRRGGALVAREIFALTAKGTRRVELRVGAPISDSDPADKPADPGTKPADKPADKPVDKPTDPVPKPVDPPPNTGRVQRALGWTAVGIGAGAAVGMGVFIGLRAGAMNRLQMSCPTHTQCSPGLASTVNEGKLDAALVNVFGALAVAGVAGGTALLLTAPSPPPPAPPKTSILLRPTLGGVSLEGTF